MRRLLPLAALFPLRACSASSGANSAPASAPLSQGVFFDHAGAAQERGE